MNLPKDPMMLFSVINMQLRDNYPSLRELAAACGEDEQEIRDRLAAVGFTYDPKQNQFV